MSAAAFRRFAGLSLEAVLRQGPLDPASSLRIACALTRKLDELHSAPVIHGNVCPTNIVFSDAGDAIELANPLGDGASTSPDWAYLSPEQTGRMNRDVDHRADLYSLGVTLYRMFTGALPFACQGRARVGALPHRPRRATSRPSATPACRKRSPTS